MYLFHPISDILLTLSSQKSNLIDDINCSVHKTLEKNER